jgi:hypothetical protein
MIASWKKSEQVSTICNGFMVQCLCSSGRNRVFQNPPI